jgi:hypothetical protein
MCTVSCCGAAARLTREAGDLSARVLMRCTETGMFPVGSLRLVQRERGGGEPATRPTRTRRWGACGSSNVNEVNAEKATVPQDLTDRHKRRPAQRGALPIGERVRSGHAECRRRAGGNRSTIRVPVEPAVDRCGGRHRRVPVGNVADRPTGTRRRDDPEEELNVPDAANRPPSPPGGGRIRRTPSVRRRPEPKGSGLGPAAMAAAGGGPGEQSWASGLVRLENH